MRGAACLSLVAAGESLAVAAFTNWIAGAVFFAVMVPLAFLAGALISPPR